VPILAAGRTPEAARITSVTTVPSTASSLPRRGAAKVSEISCRRCCPGRRAALSTTRRASCGR
jgi:hypothetical protein